MRWKVTLEANGRGTVEVVEAAHAYDALALVHHGAFALLNFNPDGSPGPARGPKGGGR